MELEHKRLHKSYLPLINRGVWSRVYAFSHNIREIINYLKEIEYEDELNIIDLGSGFNTLFFTLEQEYENLKYVEVDFEENTYKKVTSYIIISDKFNLNIFFIGLEICFLRINSHDAKKKKYF